MRRCNHRDISTPAARRRSAASAPSSPTAHRTVRRRRPWRGRPPARSRRAAAIGRASHVPSGLPFRYLSSSARSSNRNALHPQRRPADAAGGAHYGWRNGRMTTDTETAAPKAHGWRGQLLQLAAIVLAVFLAKGAFAEPFYVPSGSMEPTLLIGDALLASKYPYGYGAASLPIQITLPETGRVFGGTPN